MIFLDALESIRQRHRFFVFGYVLMPEHVHLLVSEPQSEQLHNTLRVLKGQTSKLLKGKRDKFWQSRSYDFNVFTLLKFVEKLGYLHRNPVRRGLVQKPEDWPWSSYRHWASGEIGTVQIESHWAWNRRERNPIPLIAIQPR